MMIWNDEKLPLENGFRLADIWRVMSIFVAALDERHKKQGGAGIRYQRGQQYVLGHLYKCMSPSRLTEFLWEIVPYFLSWENGEPNATSESWTKESMLSYLQEEEVILGTPADTMKTAAWARQVYKILNLLTHFRMSYPVRQPGEPPWVASDFILWASAKGGYSYDSYADAIANMKAQPASAWKVGTEYRQNKFGSFPSFFSHTVQSFVKFAVSSIGYTAGGSLQDGVKATLYADVTSFYQGDSPFWSPWRDTPGWAEIGSAICSKAEAPAEIIVANAVFETPAIAPEFEGAYGLNYNVNYPHYFQVVYDCRPVMNYYDPPEIWSEIK